MKKRFLFGMSFLLIASFFNLHPEEIKETNTESSSYIFPGANFTFAQQWFEKIKRKYADAGFDKATFLRESPNESNALGQWSANFFKNPNNEFKQAFSKELLKDEYNNLEKIKVIFSGRYDLVELDRVCRIYYEHPEEFSVKDKEHLDRIEGTLLHEIYHCLQMPEVPNKIIYPIFATTSLGLIPATIASFLAKEPVYKKYASRNLKVLGAIWVTSYILLIGSAFYNMRQNEYEADMHSIKYGTPETIQGFTSVLKDLKKDELLLNSTIEKVESLQKDAWDIAKPSYKTLLYALKGVKSMAYTISKPTHPSLETRIKYFTEALEKTKQ